MTQHQQHPPRLRRGLAAFLLCLAGMAQAADQTGSTEADSDLYLKALQSIAEGRRSDASEELSQLIAQQPEHAGAWLDLALTQCSLGRADEAERLFAAFETRFEPARPILELIAEAREQGCNNWAPFSSTLITLGRGIDQNVNQGARTARYVVDAPGGQVEYELSEDFRPRHDQYIQLSGEYLREVTPNGTLGFVQYQLRRNDNLHQYDSGSLFTGLEKPWRFGNWRVRGTGTLGLVSLGGKLYQRQAQLQARVTPPLDLPDGVLLDLVGGVTYNTFPTLTNFDSSTQEARAHLSWREPGRLLSATLGYLNDHALAQRPGGDREGSFVNLLARRTVWYGVSAELGYTRQTWNSSKAYAPGLIEQTRAQTTQVLRGTLIYPINKNQSVQLEGRIVRNSENISIFQYNNRQLQFSWQWQLP
jgi:hypothetical protein